MQKPVVVTRAMLWQNCHGRVWLFLCDQMPTPAVSLRLKRFRSRFGIAAPRVVVRTAVPPQWLVLGGVSLLLLLLFVFWLLYSGRLGESERLAELNERLNSQQAELVALRSTAGTGQSAVSMERAAQRQLVTRIVELEAENAALKEDMLIFERLIPAAGQESSARIESLRVKPDAGGRYRYRLLFAYQPARRGGSFRGKYDVVAVFKDADGVERRQPATGEVEIRHFLRREGWFELPEGAVLLSVDASLLQNGKVVATQKIEF